MSEQVALMTADEGGDYERLFSTEPNERGELESRLFPSGTSS